ncbi:peptidase [Enterobacter cancerogenus]|nr:peptidase [Enterobacter cancerogenus]
MTIANINPAMLSWSRERAGFTLEKLAQKCGITLERLQEWESGQQPLTFNQAMAFAGKVHVPFGYLFLPHPPEEQLPIPDLRTIGSKGPLRPSAELIDLLKVMLMRQEWYREYLQQQLIAAPNISGRFTVGSSANAIVEDMRHKLNLPAHPTRGTWENYYNELIKRIEDLGILVMRAPYLNHHTRPFNVDEFRGFAIADDFAPIIFINHADTPGARLFTLIHELGHIWIGQSGVSDGGTSTHRQEEILCNAVAAEFLVPASEFLSLWNAYKENWRENLAPLEGHFHVSCWVIARRALTLQLISHEDYQQFIQEQKLTHQQRSKNDSGGPSYFRTKKAQISPSFSRAVLSQALSGQMLLREASDLLDGMQPSRLSKFAEEMGL